MVFKNEKQNQKKSDMTPPRYDGEEDLCNIYVGEFEQRQGHLGEARVDLTLSYVWRRGEERKGKREEQGSATRRPKGLRDNKNVDYMGRLAEEQQLHPSPGAVKGRDEVCHPRGPCIR